MIFKQAITILAACAASSAEAHEEHNRFRRLRHGRRTQAQDVKTPPTDSSELLPGLHKLHLMNFDVIKGQEISKTELSMDYTANHSHDNVRRRTQDTSGSIDLSEDKMNDIITKDPPEFSMSYEDDDGFDIADLPGATFSDAEPLVGPHDSIPLDDDAIAIIERLKELGITSIKDFVLSQDDSHDENKEDSNERALQSGYQFSNSGKSPYSSSDGPKSPEGIDDEAIALIKRLREMGITSFKDVMPDLDSGDEEDPNERKLQGDGQVVTTGTGEYNDDSSDPKFVLTEKDVVDLLKRLDVIDSATAQTFYDDYAQKNQKEQEQVLEQELYDNDWLDRVVEKDPGVAPYDYNHD